MKPGSGDVKVHVRMPADELAELQRHTWAMSEAFGLDSRIGRYQGKRPIGLYRWDLDCLIDVISLVLDDSKDYPSKSAPEYLALRRLHERLQEACRQAFH
jgi:hypothetical protein